MSQSIQTDEKADAKTNAAFPDFESEDVKKAFSFLDKQIELTPEDSHLYELRGFVYMRFDKLDNALKDYNKAVDLILKIQTFIHDVVKSIGIKITIQKHYRTMKRLSRSA